VQRDEGRRRLRRVLVLALVTATVLGGYLLTRSPLLDVDRVRVLGSTRVPEEAVVAMSGITDGDPMTGVALGDVHDAVAAMPWVDTVRVERRWPGTIEIRITERVPAAAMQAADGSWSIADGTGRVLEHVLAPPPELPVVVLRDGALDPGARQPGIAGALEVVHLLTPDLRAWLVAVQPAEDGTVDLLLQDDIRVELGSLAHLSDKLGDLATTLTRVDLTDLEVIDLRVVHTPVLTRGSPG
jgi:cell division protein FtsQ